MKATDKLMYTNGCAHFLDGHKEDIFLAIILCHDIYFFTKSGKYVCDKSGEIYGSRSRFVMRPNCNFLKCVSVTSYFNEMRVMQEYAPASIDYINIFEDGQVIMEGL